MDLLGTVAMFLVLIFRAWVEFKNFRLIWEDLEWRRTRRAAGGVLKAEKETFQKMKGGPELYEILSHMFQVDED